jgi:hypothetical protein
MTTYWLKTFRALKRKRDRISRARLFACARDNTPPSVRVIRIREEPRGKAYCDPRLREFGKLITPRPVNRLALSILLHENAHFTLHCSAKNGGPELEEEYEAEQWVLRAFRQAGIPIPRMVRQFMRQNVACWIIRELKWGTLVWRNKAAPSIRPEIARFALGRNWKRKLALTHEALLANDLDALDGIFGF